MADGVEAEELYPLDVPRAFASLDRIRDATQFYEDGKSRSSSCARAAGLASAWNVRTALPDVQSLVKVQWNGGMLAADSWVIPAELPIRTWP
jgi:putative spermidine/putrescine transport system substrate-binding protein